MSLISIIVPVYNAEKYLERCILSVLNQSYCNFELILVDDGSTDDSKKICEAYAQKDDRIIVIAQKNSGVSSARNCGLRYATGEYISFLDADDFLEKDFCKLMEGKMSCDISLVICGVKFIYSDHIDTSQWQMNTYFDYNDLPEAMLQLRKNGMLYASWNKLYRRENINFHFIEDMTFAEDSCFVLQYLSKCNKIAVISEPLYNYDETIPESALKRYHSGIFENCKIEYKIAKQYLNDFCDNEIFERMLNDHYFENIFEYGIKPLVHKSKLSRKQQVLMLKQVCNDALVKKMLKQYRPKTVKDTIKWFCLKYGWVNILLLLVVING